VQLVRKKLNVVADGGRRKLSVVTDGATGKRSAVLNFYPYRTRISSHNLPYVLICGAYAKYMRTYNYKISMLNGLLVDTYAKHMLSIFLAYTDNKVYSTFLEL
jgi:hypothetical protein